MSNHLAIATVTASFAEILRSAARTVIPNADTEISTRRPDDPRTQNTPPRINLYLYTVVPNAALRNADLPGRRSDGSLIQRPQAAVDLHYLLTFYGNEGQYHSQRLMASVIASLHARPVLSQEAIRALIQSVQNPNHAQNVLITSDLAEQVELVRFSPMSLNLEELSKLWSVFFQTPYWLSIAYQASVVLIEPEGENPRPALPVRDRAVYVMPFRQPLIKQVTSEETRNPLLLANSVLRIQGGQLRGDLTLLRICGVEIQPREEDATEEQIRIPLGALPIGSLRAGLQGVQVLHKLLIGSPAQPHHGFASAVFAFVLSPIISDMEVSSSHLILQINPLIGQSQHSVLLLNEINPPHNRAARSYSFDASKMAGISMDIASVPEDPALQELGLDRAIQVWGRLSKKLPGNGALTQTPGRILAIIGKEGPHEVMIEGGPAGPEEIRTALEKGLHAAHNSDEFKTARVLLLDNRLLVLSGTGSEVLAFMPAGNDPALYKLGYGDSVPVWGFQSGDLTDYAGLTNDPGRIRITIGMQGPYDVKVVGPAPTLDAAGERLQAALQAVTQGGSPFIRTRVVKLDNRLLIFPGFGIDFEIPGVSPGDYLVRIQVDGAESPLETDNEGLYCSPKVAIL
jgi:hypothetical protein